MRFARSVLSAALLACVAPVLAHDYSADGLTIAHPWSRPTPPGVETGVGYMKITNTGEADVTLVSAQTPRAERVTIHESLMENGLMKMQALDDGLEIAAGETVALKPKSYHLMLEKLNESLVEGQRVPLTLEFESDEGARRIEVELAVGAIDGDGSEHGDHSGH